MLRFYHAAGETPAALDALLPALLAKITSTGQSVALVVADDARAERLCETLWTYHPASFLPHGRLSDGPPPEAHPTLILTAQELAENPQPQRLPLFLAGTESHIPETTGDTLHCYLFFSAPAVLETARKVYAHRQKAAKAGQGPTPQYFQQTPTGWAKKEATPSRPTAK